MTIECHLSNNLPNIVIVGFANKAVDEAKERIRGAFATSHIMLPRKRITVNLAPADVPKDDSGFDLAIAAAILGASESLPIGLGPHEALIGELGLDGSLRPVRGIIGKLLVGRARGITTFYVPTANHRQAELVPGINLVALDSLAQLYGHVTGVCQLQPRPTGRGRFQQPTMMAAANVSLGEIVGQHQAKRALIIAAAGGHNLLLSGPPGTGKSMLAKAMPSILPPLSREEALEVTHLHSLANPNYEQIIDQRPFRSPHHSASHVAIVGGGMNIRPGEISLAHRGVLFFDELPEFSRLTLEALRQPLEDRVISVARAKDTIEYPANFILVATANPCPCGYYGALRAAQTCHCLAWQVKRYQRRLSGPILDRIDLYSNVHEVDHDRLLTSGTPTDDAAAVRQQIAAARSRQQHRYKALGASRLNSDMTNAELRRFGHLTAEAKGLFNDAARQLNLSARSYMRVVKVARTIADLESSTGITASHITEALAYRPVAAAST